MKHFRDKTFWTTLLWQPVTMRDVLIGVCILLLVLLIKEVLLGS